jgi:NAD+-dependent secondary alcohol dehydrogenase Adh1
MKAAVLHQYDTTLTNPDFVVGEEVPEPKIEKQTDVIVRVGGAGVCRTDRVPVAHVLVRSELRLPNGD